MRWTRKSIIAEINRLHEKGEQLNYSAAEANHLNLVRAAAWHYGTWRRAVEAAGIQYESLSRYQRWSKKRIVERIQELHKQDQDLSWRAVSTQLDPPLAAAALRPNGFSSWREAVAAAGIDVEDVTRYKYWDSDKVLREIKARKRRGAPMSSKSLQTSDQSLFCAARRRFGSWDGALDAAGLNAEKIRLRRHNPGLNAPRRKKAEGGETASPNGRATAPVTISAPTRNTSSTKPAAVAKTSTAKTSTTKASTAKAPTAKAAAHKATARKATASKAPAKAAGKNAGKVSLPAAKSAGKKALGKPVATKAVPAKVAAMKPVAKRGASEVAAAKQPAAKKAPTQKMAAQKPVAARSVASKAPARKTASRKAIGRAAS